MTHPVSDLSLKPWPNMVGGGLAAAIAGGVLAAFELVMFQILLYILDAQPHLDIDMAGLGRVFLTSTVVFTVGFAVGALVLAAPVWALFHSLGLRRKGVAMAMGGVLAGLAAAAPPVLMLGAPGLVAALPGGVMMAATGAAAGWVAHRLAYGPSSGWF